MRLNRLFTISAVAEEFEETPIPWRYGDYGAGGGLGLAYPLRASMYGTTIYP